MQAAWAGLKGRRAFRDQLARQSIRGLGVACINEALSHAWIGHEEVRKEGSDTTIGGGGGGVTSANSQTDGVTPSLGCAA